MRQETVCKTCESVDIDYLGNDECYCHKCNKKTDTVTRFVYNHYERRRAQVYATGNKWAIENWKATHE